MATLTDVGKAQSAKLLTGTGGSAFTYIALGSGTDAEASGDTSLVTEITSNGGSRTTAATISTTTTNVTDDTGHWEHTFNFTGSLTINEVGVFDAETGGNMYMRHVLGVTREVVDGDTLTVTIDSVQSEGA